MKLYKAWMFLIFSIVFLVTDYSVSASAMNTGLETEELSAEQLEQEKENIRITLMDKMPEGLTIDSFDVNEKGMIAIKFYNASSTCYLGIYDTEGRFQYGYTYGAGGSSAVEWDGDKINIYLVREAIVYSINPDEEIECIFSVKQNAKNTKYSSDCMQAKKKTMGDLEYYMTNGKHVINWFSTSYAQLIVKNTDGEKTVIYDAFENGYEALRPQIVYHFVEMGVIVLLVFFLFKKFIKQINDPDLRDSFRI